MHDPNPFSTLQQIAGGYCLPRCLHVVADLGVADVLDETPQTAAALAASVGVHAEALGRVLRLLSAHGVFESQDDRFRHSPASRLLRTDHPQSMRAFARMFGLPVGWAAAGDLEHAVRTGESVVGSDLPGAFWDYFAEHPEENVIFHTAMAAKAHGHVAAIVAAYDFSDFGVIGDIGGGRGQLIRALLEAAPRAKGVLFDLPQAMEKSTGAPSERLTLHAGDFFSDDLPVCDAYLLMEVIHDWGDEESVAILQAIRRSAPPHAKVLLIEQIIPNDPGPHWAKTLDIHMLTQLGGRQRTRREHEMLLTRAGFSFEREIHTSADISIHEAVLA